MKRSCFALSTLSSVLLFANACSSDPEPPPQGSDSSDAGAEAANAPTTCVADTMRVAEDDSEVCCPGLFKACVNVSMAGQSPCICSTVACGTEANPPPPNVPCCPEALSQDCQAAIGGDTTCTCGPTE